MSIQFPFFLLISICLLISCSSPQKELNCERFKAGRFLFCSDLDSATYLIERDDKIQIETNTKTGHSMKAKIKWTGECEYELTYLEETSNNPDSLINIIKSLVLKAIILKTTKDYCIFKANMLGTNVSLTDTLRVIK